MKWVPFVGPALFVFSLALRLVGIGWGLQNDLHRHSYHPDEPIIWAYSQQIEPASLKFTPGYYNYGTLYLTLARIASAWCPLPEAVNDDSIAEFARCCEQAGRLLSALAGAGTVWIVYAALRRRTGTFGSLLGGLAIGLAPAFVVHSRFQTVDVTATFFLAVSLYAALRLLPDQAGDVTTHFGRWVLVSAAAAGLSAGTKYTGVLALLALYAALFLSRRPGALKLAVLGTVTAVLAFLVATPGALLEPQKFMEGLSYEMAHTASGHDLVFLGTPPGYVDHLINLGVGFGLLALLIGLAGLIYPAVRRHSWALVLLAFAVPYYLVIGHAEVKFLRYTFPLMVPLAIAVGWALGQAHRRGGNLRFAVLLGIIAVGVQLRSAALYTLWMVEEDPRDAAGRFLASEARKRPGMAVGVMSDPWFWSPALYKDVAMSRPEWARKGPQRMAEAQDPRVVRFSPSERPEYVAATSLDETHDLQRLAAAPSLSPEVQKRVEDWRAAQDRLAAEYVQLPVIGAYPRIYRHDLEYIHPEVTLWKRKDLP